MTFALVAAAALAQAVSPGATPLPAAAKPVAPSAARPAAGSVTVPLAKPASQPTAANAPVAQPTPASERVTTLMALDKRTGTTRAFAVKSGGQVAFGSLLIRVRVCETTPEWEQKSTAAFLQIDEAASPTSRKRVYSGWMFAESPSLNPLQSPRYDVWVKSCTMRFPDTGPATVVASRGTAPAGKPRSSAAKSPEPATAVAN